MLTMVNITVISLVMKAIFRNMDTLMITTKLIMTSMEKFTKPITSHTMWITTMTTMMTITTTMKLNMLITMTFTTNMITIMSHNSTIFTMSMTTDMRDITSMKRLSVQ